MIGTKKYKLNLIDESRNNFINNSIIYVLGLSYKRAGNNYCPRDYTGYIIVIFNQEDGKPVKYEGKKRVYEIPSDGILKTQFNINDGWGDYPIFYYESIAPENKLPSNILSAIESLPLDTIVGL